MAHFAEVDAQGVVQRVIVIELEALQSGEWGDPASWIQTSYNTRGGVYYTPSTDAVDADQSKAFRKNYAGVGYLWIPNGPDGEGFAPPKPDPSWVLNPATYEWEAP